uniref:Zinc finger protein 555 (Trinotate prediction) n=1 Tax=Myxobolus squamalis TaxID=59785 RepID=A0A6B2FZ80_MYXSQ
MVSIFVHCVGYTFPTKKILLAHFSEFHDKPDSKKFHCHLCSNTFSQYRYLKAHHSRHFSDTKVLAKENVKEKPGSSELNDKPDWLNNFEVTEQNLSTALHDVDVTTSTAQNLNAIKPSPLWWEKKAINTEPIVIVPPIPDNFETTCYKCKKCLKIDYDLSKAHRHYLSCFGEPSIICNVCGLLQYSKTELKRHKIRKHNIFIAECLICSLEFPKILQLINHLKQNHEFDHSLLCEKCGRISPNEKSFKRHSKTHVKLKESVFICSICGKKLATRDSHRAHAKMHAIKNIPQIQKFN